MAYRINDRAGASGADTLAPARVNAANGERAGLEQVLISRAWRPNIELSVHPYTLFLTAILFFALFLRLFGTDWDQGGLFHPDERDFLTRAERIDFADLGNPSKFLSVESRMNPHWFNYGSLPLYALAGIKAIANPFTDLDWNLFDLRFPGRNLAALSDTITVLLIFLLARRLFDVRAALTAALLAALAVIHIQNAHYTAVDAPMTMFVTATIYFSVRVVQEGRLRDSMLAGAMLGLAIACKFSAAPVAIAIVASHLLNAATPLLRGESIRAIDSEAVLYAIKGCIIAVIAALITVAILQPYMIIDWETYIANVGQQSDMVRRIIDYPFTRQYLDTAPYWYQARQLSTWGLGIALGITVWIGLAWAIGRALICRDRAIIVVLSFLLLYLLVTGWFEVKFLRYMLPATPLLIILAGGFIWWTYDRIVRHMRRAARYFIYLIAALAMLSLVHYSLAYMNVFQGDHPAQSISKWLRDNAEPGAIVIQEHWEEGIPNVPELNMHERIPMYESDTRNKYASIADTMENADYFILYSNRLSATIPRLPDRYPVGARFYELLFNGELGYRYAYSAERNPEFLGIMYRDDPYARVPFSEPAGYRYPKASLFNWSWYGWADESHTVYEHPHAIVFENAEHLSRSELLNRLRIDELLLGPGGTVKPHVGLKLSASDAEIQQSGGTWTSVYYLHRMVNGLAWLPWLLAVQIISLAAVPLSYWLFRPLPDRGYLFSKPIGLLLVATSSWLLASYQLMGFSALSVALSIAILAAVSGLILWRLRIEIWAYFKAHWKMVAVAEAIFLLAFFAFLMVRLANPDLWHAWRGGEKPMDFAYLNAITKSTIMPPYDPWFAGGYMNYYYYGQFIVASIIRLTGIAPNVAYNLAVPLLFALTATSVYAVTSNLITLTIRARGVTSASNKPIIFGIVAILLTVVAGNIDGLVQVLDGVRRVIFEALPFGFFDYWRSSRMLEPGTGGNEITEFPFFTFLYADLHAHMIALPFAILALGLAIAVFLRAGLQKVSRLETFAALAALGISIGALRIINSWDFPTLLLLSSALIFIGEIFFGHRRNVIAKVWAAIVKIIIVAVVGYLVYLPFHSNFQLFNDGVQSSLYQTPLWRYIAIHSIFLFAIFSWVFMEWDRGAFGFGRSVKRSVLNRDFSIWKPLFIAFGLGAIWTSLFFVLPDYATVFATFTGAAILIATVLMAMVGFNYDQRYLIIIAGIAILALMLAAAVDLFTIKNDIGRQNTIFKFYIQAWWLLSIAAAFATWRLWEAGAFSRRKFNPLRAAWIAIFALLAIGVFIYPVLGTRERISDRFSIIGMGIDGEAYMNHAIYHRRDYTFDLSLDRPGIQWLRANVQGSPVIIEGVWDLYTWSQRISIYTGLPTVIGWDWHQTQQRLDYSWEIDQRQQAVNDFYSSEDTQHAIDFIKDYGVKYIYIGEMERRLYPEAGIQKFDAMAPMGINLVFQSGPVAIYRYLE